MLLGVDPEGLDRALSLARLDDDLHEMVHGRRTLVGPKGVRLSGGQIQRAAAARAFVREPELLVVDDLSSALDVATETALWDGLFAAAERTEDVPEGYENEAIIGLRFKIALPFWNKNEGAIQEAEAASFRDGTIR